jgi:hypothetical protein
MHEENKTCIPGQKTSQEEIREDNIEKNLREIVIQKPEGKKSFADVSGDERIILILAL